MAVFSKSVFERLVKNRNCCEVIHPWDGSCVKGNLTLIVSCACGAMKFYTLMYSAVLLLKMKSKKKVDFKNEFKKFLRSVTAIIVLAGSYTTFNCLFRKCFGQFNFYFTMMVMPAISFSMFAFLESHERILFNVTTFLTGALEGFYSKLLHDRNLRRSTFLETLAFMLLNGTLMYALRAQQKDTHGAWFFTPSEINNSEFKELQKECTHKETCTLSLQKDVCKFGGIALLLSSLKLISQNLKNPSKATKLFFKWNNWKLATLVGAYIGIFKAVNCFLCKTRGDSLQNTFIAGLIAGLSYSIGPKITFFFSTITALTKVTGNEIKKKYNTPDLPYLKIVLLLSLIFLFYLRIVHKPSCPKYIYNILEMISSNKFNDLIENLHKLNLEGMKH